MKEVNLVVNKNAFLDENQEFNEEITDSFDFDELEKKLQEQMEKDFDELKFLANEKEKIADPDNLGNMVMDIVWEQFRNQIGVVAGEDFIKENNGLKLDLSNKAHIQTTENFANGKISSHNTKIHYQERHDDWGNNFQKNEDGSIRTTVNRKTGEEKAALRRRNTKKDPEKKNYNTNYDARGDFDKGRPTGKNTNNTNMDHTIAAAEIIRDPKANAHMTREEQVAFANSEKNLNLMDSSANQSKSDSTMSEWLDSERDGKKAAERFNIDEEALRKKDKEAREEFEKQKKEAEQKSIEAGKQSQKEEAFRIGGKAARAVVMGLLADLLKEIMSKLVKWFKSDNKKLESLLDYVKEAIHSFIGNMKKHLINARNTVCNTIATAIIGPILGTIKKAWMLVKQGWQSIKNAVNYIKNPENKDKPISQLILETGKIIIAGLTGAGALVLGEVIEKSLIAIPIFAIEIPLIGSLANVLGIFLGAVVAGIIGAIAINFIEKKIEKNKKRELVNAEINKGNDILNTQKQIQIVNKEKYEYRKLEVENKIKERHDAAANAMKEFLEKVIGNCDEDESIQSGFDDIDSLLDELEGDVQ